MKEAENGDGRKGNSQAGASGQVGDLSQEPEDEVSNPKGAGVLAFPTEESSRHGPEPRGDLRRDKMSSAEADYVLLACRSWS